MGSALAAVGRAALEEEGASPAAAAHAGGGVRSSRAAGGVGRCGGRVSDRSLREDLAAVFGGALGLAGLWRVPAERV